MTVDSAPIIYFLEDHPRLAARFAPVFEAEAEGALDIVISAITVAEVLAGPLKAGNEALAASYRRALSLWEIVSVDAELAALAARLRIAHGLRLPDALQAATALVSGSAALITHDRDFSRLDSLRVIDGTAQT
ncbi:MAG: type II toxin-antitoxin system VapC family toxin [Burkholderiales bacterium]